MKRLTLLSILILLLFLSSCNMPEKVTEEMMRTFVASTMQAKINEIGSMTPPTPTPTNTSTPTETPPPTMTPTPTIEPTPTWVMHEKGSAEVLILYYHDIVKDRKDDAYYQWEFENWYVKPVEFEQQMRILSELGYTSITISDLHKILYEGGELPGRPVMITFDSTEMGQWKNAYPTMKKYGLVGNLFINSYHVDAKNSLSSEQINQMLKDGWEIGSSGNDQGDDGRRLANPSRYGMEIAQSKIQLEEKFPGVKILAFAYPDGYTDPEGEIVRRTSQSYQMAFSRLKSLSNEISVNQVYFIPRVEITGGMSYNDFFNLLPWKEGSISQETMEWTLPKPTLDPKAAKATKAAEATLIALDATNFPAEGK